jgi:hypothetical protein
MTPAGAMFDLATLAWVLLALGALFVIFAFVALGAGKPMGCVMRGTLGLATLALGVILAAGALGLRGYNGFTREDVVATVRVRPVAPQRFDAEVRLPDGRTLGFVLAGDELYIDAHILKWQPIAAYLGLHTVYQLDRVAGRYRNIEQERASVRTVHSIAPDTLVDLFDLRRRYAFLAPLFDAEYGSASFVAVTRPAELEVRVSTTGLLIREADPNRKP